jgi:hypothetical protein
MKISEFPDDEGLWVVKWIDGYTLPHLTTRSASVLVLLQRLAQDDVSAIAKLSPYEVADILGTPPKSLQAVLPSQRQYTQCAMHTGTLPLVAIGFVFKAQQLVGVLPGSSYPLLLPSGRDEWHSKKVGDKHSPPDGWDEKFPYYSLNNFEFSHVTHWSPQSRLMVFEGWDADYIIPNQVIFQTCYAPETQMARAFTNGPWHDTASQVIYFGNTTMGGLETSIDANTGQWNVILESRVKDDFARHLALLWWDDFAKARANEIHARAVQERGSNSLARWHSQANFPFREDYPLRMQVVGYELRPWSLKNQGSRPRILVSRIVDIEEPPYLPKIGYERLNSGREGGNKVEKPGSAPYSKTATIDDLDRPTDTTEVSAEKDGAEQSAIQKLLIGTFQWGNARPLEKLKKNQSGLYAKAPQPKPDPKETTSTGNPNYQEGSSDPLNANIVIRDPVQRFTQLVEALTNLQSTGKIERFTVFPPTTPAALELRAALSCWNFLNDDERRTGRVAKRGWHVMREKHDNAEGARRAKRQIRCALILEIEVLGKRAYWIEIECKDNDSFKSPVIANVEPPNDEYFFDLLHAIWRSNGIGLDKKLAQLMGKIGGSLTCYKHCYYSSADAKLDAASVLRFLRRSIGAG